MSNRSLPDDSPAGPTSRRSGLSGRGAGASLRVAIVGAGIAGLSCARALGGRGHEVTVFDKGRSVGGRLSTRRSGPHTFDLGAQYFTVRTPAFQRVVEEWLSANACHLWSGRFAAWSSTATAPSDELDPIARYVGTPDMSAIARHLALDLDVRPSHRVDVIRRRGDGFVLLGTRGASGDTLGPSGVSEASAASDELGQFDRVVVCLPPKQAAFLLDGVAPELATLSRAVGFEPCFALGFAATGALADALGRVSFDGAFVGRERDGAARPVSWMARDSSKPGRPPGERWVLHASAPWTRAHESSPEADVRQAMLTEFAERVGLTSCDPQLVVLRRWAFARAAWPLSQGALSDESGQIFVGGDWAIGGRVEGAYLSGLELGRRVDQASDLEMPDSMPPASVTLVAG